MPNVKLVVEYNGRGFHGWQKQPNLKTVQSELERVLKIIVRSPMGPLHAAGRTDAGVHARGQVVTFRVDDPPELWRIAQGVSHLMKGELSVLSAEIVSDDFHPGIASTHKQYSYRILNRPTPAVLEAHLMWHIAHRLDLVLMREQLACLLGEHDFSSFRDSSCTAKTPIKTIYSAEITTAGDVITFTVVGSGFLKQMVRNLVGTLTDIGRDRLHGRTMLEVLEARDRRVAGVTAPAHGLIMDWVSYDELPLVETGSSSTNLADATGSNASTFVDSAASSTPPRKRFC
ncbi:MAG: tRNA pseudouridine(38-40) synthase TruA [Pseudomonadota bacterium]